MDQYLFLNFAINKNERSYQLLIQPGAPFEDIQAILDQYKADFATLQEQQKAKAEEEKSKAEAVVSEPVEAEVVS